VAAADAVVDREQTNMTNIKHILKIAAVAVALSTVASALAAPAITRC
jgi:hypothetical protein